MLSFKTSVSNLPKKKKKKNNNNNNLEVLLSVSFFDISNKLSNFPDGTFPACANIILSISAIHTDLIGARVCVCAGGGILYIPCIYLF